MPVLADIRPKPEELARASRSSLGLEPADLVITNASVVDVWRGEIIDRVNIAVKGRIITCVGRCERSRGIYTREIDARGKTLAPGFIDAHTHIESTLLRPAEFSKAVLSRGTTTVFADPHEIANVAGLAGVEYMARELSGSPLKVFLLIPPNVPASLRSPDRGGAVIGYDEILGNVDRFSGVGEIMDTGSLLDGDSVFLEYSSRLAMRQIVQGHAAGLSGEDLDAYISLGISNDHEVTSWEELSERLSKGMIPIVRYGSSWRDLERLYRAIDRFPHIVPIATDDIHCLHIAREGHMDRAVRRAIELGVDPVKAIASATIAPAILYGLHRWLGSIAPGRYADLVLISDLEKVSVEEVYVDGTLVAREYKYLGPEDPIALSEPIIANSIKAPQHLRISLDLPKGCEEVVVRAVRPIHGTTLTREERVRLECSAKNIGEGLVYISVVNRYGSGHSYTGVGVDIPIEGAIASSIAHDSHNIIAVGSSLEDVTSAIKAVIELGGGIVFTHRSKVEASVELRIAGLMSTKSYYEVASELGGLFRTLREHGAEDPEGLLQEIQLLSLTVIPEIRITDRGLYRVLERRIVDLVVGVE